MRKLIFIILLMSGIWSCNKKIVPVVALQKDSTEHKTGLIQTEKETNLKPDSALVRAYIKCDSTGRAYLATINQLQGERVSQSINQNSQGKDLEIEIKAKDKAKEKIKETFSYDSLYKYKEVPVPYPVETPVNYVSGWQWFQIWMGRILLVLFIAANAYRKFKNKFQSLLNGIKSIFN